MRVLETPRLRLREFCSSDAEFILRLLNDPGWLRYIGDRDVRTAADAARYIEDKLADQYRRFGFGLWCVERKDEPGAVGMCGLVRRESLSGPDLGFAFLPEYRGLGFALESATAVLAWASGFRGLRRLLAITAPDNVPALKLLHRLGFRSADPVGERGATGIVLLDIALDGRPGPA